MQNAKMHCTIVAMSIWLRGFPGCFSIIEFMTVTSNNNMKKEPNNTASLIPADSRIFFKTGYVSDIKFLSSEYEISTQIFLSNHRIFSQILTRALKQNLTFKQKIGSISDT